MGTYDKPAVSPRRYLRRNRHHEDIARVSIQPISDIILDVAMAADPAKASAAKQRLSELDDASGRSFGEVLSAQTGETSTRWSPLAEARFFSAPTGVAIKEKASMDQAKRGLETLVAKMLVESMLPKEGGTFFGKDNAGGVWRSMLADKIATEMTKGKGLGILPANVMKKG
ncbi:MAG: putative flagellar protein FlgJ-like protein [Hyphomicrobiales bacterium]|nr:putative flagellar protein FlgJ-like protein [Hyphomicrobiales bacterium]